MTPFAAWVPYSVAADGPLTISILDLLGIQIVEFRNACAADEGAGRCVGCYPDSVDIEQRVVGKRHRAQTPHANPCSGAARPGALKHADSGHAAAQDLRHVGGRGGLDQLSGLNFRHRVTELSRLLITRGRSHDLFKLKRHRSQGPVDCFRARPGRHAPRLRRVAQHERPQRVGSSGQTSKRVLALLIRDRKHLLSSSLNSGPGNRPAGRLIGDRAGYRPGLSQQWTSQRGARSHCKRPRREAGP